MNLRKNNPQAGVYKIVNIMDGKVYIGGTCNLSRRKYEHWTRLQRGDNKNSRLQEAYNIYGRNGFRFDVIQTLGSKSDIKKVEQKYIDEYKAYNPRFGYNIAPFSDSSKGVPCSEQKKVLISVANTGKKHTEECKERISRFMTQRNLNASPETYRRLSETQAQRYNTPWGRESGRRIGLMNRRITNKQIDEMIEMYKSGISQAEVSLKFNVNKFYYSTSPRVKRRIAERERVILC